LVVFLCAGSAQAKTETWYWGIDLGFGSVSLPAELDGYLTALNAGDSGGRLGVCSSLHFYWPLDASPNQVLGVAASGCRQYLRLETRDSTPSAGMGVLGPSFVHTFSDEPFKGWFLRGDAGFGTADFRNDNGASLPDRSDVGFGIRGGGGYGFAVSEETRIPLQLSFLATRVKGEGYSALAIEVGFLL
jgi:hypothetical protein